MTIFPEAQRIIALAKQAGYTPTHWLLGRDVVAQMYNEGVCISRQFVTPPSAWRQAMRKARRTIQVVVGWFFPWKAPREWTFCGLPAFRAPSWNSSPEVALLVCRTNIDGRFTFHLDQIRMKEVMR